MKQFAQEKARTLLTTVIHELSRQKTQFNQ
jgi:hypothetical protein